MALRFAPRIASVDAGVGGGAGARRSLLGRLCALALRGAVPSVCAVCSAPRRDAGGGGVCGRCWAEALRWDAARSCTRCGLPDPGRECPDCRRWPGGPPDGAPRLPGRTVAWGLYAGSLRGILRAYKLGAQDLIAAPLARRLAGAAVEAGLDRQVDLVVAVPSTRSRNRRRGFDPAPLLADELSRHLRRPRRTALRRRRDGPPQSALGAAERAANAAFVFSARGVAGRRVLLVDDILTTGATVASATGALLLAGAASVDALVAARTPDSGAHAPAEA